MGAAAPGHGLNQSPKIDATQPPRQPQAMLSRLWAEATRTFLPVDTVPEKTRPNATKRPLSLVGIILDTYIIRGPSGSQFLWGFELNGVG